MKKDKTVTINGIEYVSVSVAARVLGIPRTTLVSRLKANLDGNIDITAKGDIEIEGFTFKSLRDAAKFFGVKYPTFVSRYNSGAKGKDLTSTRSRQFDGKRVEYNGYVFLKTKYLLEHYGLCQATYNGWIRYGLQPQQAIDIMLDKVKKSKEIKAA